MKHIYNVSGIFNGGKLRERSFKSRDLANAFLFHMIYKNGLQVEEDDWTEKHVEKFYCNSLNSFNVARVSVIK